MEILFFALSAIGLILLIICIIKLVLPFVGWKCVYNPSVTEMTADIPKSGRYSINIRRDRFWLWKGQGNMADAFPKVNFAVQRSYPGDDIKYTPQRSFMTSQSGGRMTVLVGYFDVPEPGDYRITSLPESRFLESDEIVIRRYVSFAKFFALIWGIIIGCMLFLAGLILGILIMTGTLDMPEATPDFMPLVPSHIERALDGDLI